MNSQDLTKFADQLSRWGREIIECGRTPFRAVETSPRVWSTQGDIEPPLVFWINRLSLQAGGLLFFDDDPSKGLIQGQACAEALGLQHFATWTADQTTIWQVGPQEPEAIRVLPFSGSGVEAFHQQLHRLMEALKLLAVTGAVPPQELPAEYLFNLCRLCLEKDFQALREEARCLLADDAELDLWIDAETLAWHTGGTAILRLLLLNWQDTLPDQLHPERLERAFSLCRSQLPEEFHPLLGEALTLPSLPHSSCVSLLGLHHRLAQVGWRFHPERAAQTVSYLWDWLLQKLHGSPLAEGAMPPSVWQDPTIPLQVAPKMERSAWPTALLARALWRTISGQPTLPQELVPPMTDCPPRDNGYWSVSLHDRGRPSVGTTDKAPLLNRLRTVWSQRRFSLPNGTPGSFFELLFWQGGKQPDQSLDLSFPAHWFQRAFFREASRLWSLTEPPCGMSLSENGRCRLRFRGGSGDHVHLTHSSTQRTVEWLPLYEQAPSALLLLTLAPDPLFEAIAGDRFQWARGSETLGRGIHEYLSTPLAAQCWWVVTGKPMPNLDDIGTLPAGLPIPEERALHQLEIEGSVQGSNQLDTGELLCQWLQWDALPTLEIPPWLQAVRAATSRPSNASLEALLRQEVDSMGLPRFPDTYLYRLEGTSLENYVLTPPFEVRESFFGQVELLDDAGVSLQVDEITAKALQMAMPNDGEGIQLPTDPEVTLQMISAYREDLEQLWSQLEKVAASQGSGPKQAQRRIRAFWQASSLPPLEKLP